MEDLDIGDAIADVDLSKKELDMARRLVDDMAAQWSPDEYQDTFTDKIMQLVEQKARAGKIENVERADEEDERRTADIVDLTELLKRSLGGKPRARSETGKGESATQKHADAGKKKTASRTKKTAATKPRKAPAKSTKKTASSTRKKTASH